MYFLESWFWLHGKRIGVAHSSDQDSLFFGNLWKEWSPEEFDKLVHQAFRDVVSVDLALASSIGNSHAERRHLNRGFAFVRFSSHAITKPADPYEEAVIELPLAVKERLLRVLRLGIATQYDVDIKCIASLQMLPEPAATSVLDQFLLSGGDKRDKGAYFVSLVDKHRVDNLGRLIWDPSRLPLKPCGFAPKEPEPYSLRHPLISQAIDLTASRYKPTAGPYPYSSQLKDELRPSHGKFGEATFRAPVFGHGGSTGSSSYFDSAVNSSIDRPTERPQMRFDPFTGQPYKFDPFTGQPYKFSNRLSETYSPCETIV